MEKPPLFSEGFIISIFCFNTHTSFSSGFSFLFRYYITFPVFSNPIPCLSAQLMGKLSENKLQNIRYHFVVTTAMIARYCVHNGMEQEKAYGLSDFYILKMDKCK
mgnify:CR=1 FL=1